MKNENENLGLTALMLEVGIVIAICLIILARLPKSDGWKAFFATVTGAVRGFVGKRFRGR